MGIYGEYGTQCVLTYKESGNSNVSMYLSERNHIFSKHIYGYLTFKVKYVLHFESKIL